jgi:tetratricopeptide (TPR) repeat protein
MIGMAADPTRARAGLQAFCCAIVLLAWGVAPAQAATAAPGNRYDAARRALARGDSDKSKRELRLSLQDNALDARSHYLLAQILGREGNLDEAIVGLRQTLALEPANAAAQYNLGTAMLMRGEPVEAARILEDLLEVRTGHAPTYNNLAKAYFMAGVPELAAATYRQVLQHDPSNAIATRNLALLSSAAGVEAAAPVDAAPAIATALAATPAIAASLPESAAPPDPEVQALAELLEVLPHVNVTRRGGRLVLDGWTSDESERKLLDRILATQPELLDLSTDDIGDRDRLLEVDATLFKVIGLDSQSVGQNFLRNIEINASIGDSSNSASNWIYTAAISYEVNIANASEQRVAFLARPHLTARSGTPAKFLAGGDIVYQVSGLNSGDIKAYPFGTTLEVTPTLLRSLGPDGLPRMRLSVMAGRRTILPLEDVAGVNEGTTVFENVVVSSEAVLGINQTLILTGLNQREQRTLRTGVPGLRRIPIIKYLFSEVLTTTSDLAIIILITPRDPAYWDARNRHATEEFVRKRRDFIAASRGTPEDMARFRERYPDWDKLAPNRFASHFFLIENSETYRRVSGIDLASDDLEFDLLGKGPSGSPKR